MKLDEIETEERLPSGFSDPRYLYYELELSDEFTRQDANKLVKKLVPRIGGMLRSKGHLGTEGMWYEILYPTQREAEQSKKILRRLSRGRPRFNIIFSTVSLKPSP
ncbi:hypothetical protein LCGC14_0919100 [marine sediment metagenome]|uniref:Uncharacterized protein n=1 Tax=marine sediment metagenome TaxID=412755 RepID=A0A0F9RXX1_9ZZZZ